MVARKTVAPARINGGGGGHVEHAQPLIEAPAFLAHPGEDDDLSDVERIRAQLSGLSGDGEQVRVYRVSPGRKDVFLCEVEAGDFNLATIQTNYGAGTYRVRAYETVDGRPALRVNQSFECGEPLKRAAPVDAPPVASNMERVLLALVDEVRALRAQPVAPPVDPLANMRQMVELAALMKTLAPPAPPAGAAFDPGAMIKLMREMKGFGEELAGTQPVKEDSDFAKLAGGVGALVQAMRQPPPAAQAPLGVDPRQITLPHVEPSGPISQPEGDDMSVMVRMAVGQLVRAAAAHEPVADVANQVMAFASDEIILGLVEPPEWFETILAAAPEAAPYRQYFEELRKELLSRYSDDAEGAPTAKVDAAIPIRRVTP